MQGMLMTVGGKTITVYGTLLVVSGDNLGSQAVGGFMQLGTAIRQCRYCMANKEDINTKVNTLHSQIMHTQKSRRHSTMQCCSQFCSSTLQLRTQGMYKVHCNRLKTIGKEASTAYGIHRDAALNKLTYFHVVDGLTPNVMHDMLEGTVN